MVLWASQIDAEDEYDAVPPSERKLQRHFELTETITWYAAFLTLFCFVSFFAAHAGDRPTHRQDIARR